MLTEEIKLICVSILTESNTINVCWQHRIFRGGEIISSTNHRCAYSHTEKVKFEADLGPNSIQYITLAGW